MAALLPLTATERRWGATAPTLRCWLLSHRVTEANELALGSNFAWYSFALR